MREAVIEMRAADECNENPKVAHSTANVPNAGRHIPTQWDLKAL